MEEPSEVNGLHYAVCWPRSFYFLKRDFKKFRKSKKGGDCLFGLDDCPFSSAFPNYTADMWNGNVPSGKGYPLVGGGHTDHWQCKYGDGDSIDGEILNAAFSISHKICIYIVGDDLRIMDIRHDGKCDYWQWTNHPKRHSETRWMHELEPDRIARILNADFQNCKFWNMVQKRAKQLYEGGIIIHG